MALSSDPLGPAAETQIEGEKQPFLNSKEAESGAVQNEIQAPKAQSQQPEVHRPKAPTTMSHRAVTSLPRSAMNRDRGEVGAKVAYNSQSCQTVKESTASKEARRPLSVTLPIP